MMAPPGPVSSEALTFTLANPPAGPRMTICVSTVSPRALDRLMEEVVPAASVVPTRTRLDTTHTGNAAPDVVLNAMRAVKTTGTVAANKRLLTRLELPRTGSPSFRPADCSWMFINAAPPRRSNFLDWGEQNRKASVYIVIFFSAYLLDPATKLRLFPV